jgi:hypothetical protein
VRVGVAEYIILFLSRGDYTCARDLSIWINYFLFNIFLGEKGI